MEDSRLRKSKVPCLRSSDWGKESVIGLKRERLVQRTSLALVGCENWIFWPGGGGPAPGALETLRAPKPTAAKARHQFRFQDLKIIELMVSGNFKQIPPIVKPKIQRFASHQHQGCSEWS
jgi:hypothetical protein